MDFWLSVFTFLTFIFVTSADSINPPGNITVLRIENRTPECPFNAEYREGQGPNSTFHISYNPSPYDTIRRLKVESLTCHSILELGYSIQNYTVAIRDAMFRAYVNLNYGEEARVEMSAVWWATTGLANFTSINVPGAGTAFEESVYNQTSLAAKCSWSDIKSNTVNILTKFSIVRGNSSGNVGRAENVVAMALPLNQTVTLGWETCRDNECVDRFGKKC